MMDDVHTSLLPSVVASEGQNTLPHMYSPTTNAMSVSDSYKGYELEDIFISFGKRVWMQIDVIVMCFNTINACFSISAAVSLIPKYNYGEYTFCDYGDNGEPIGIGVQCPYLPSPTFISLLTIWTLYFLTIFTYKVHRTFDWWSNDLRFYMACDIINNDIFMYIMVYVGIVLTLLSGLCGIYFVTQNGSDESLGN
ncbi:hypothetical protein EON65_45420 [archaeon]|nr:MAG: hypothetical protein EON65_45420 [archaeon]